MPTSLPHFHRNHYSTRYLLKYGWKCFRWNSAKLLLSGCRLRVATLIWNSWLIPAKYKIQTSTLRQYVSSLGWNGSVCGTFKGWNDKEKDSKINWSNPTLHLIETRKQVIVALKFVYRITYKEISWFKCNFVKFCIAYRLY